MSAKQNFIGWTPVKLARADGEWSLEVQRLVAISKTLYRPQHGRIHGREPILEELRDRANLCADAEAVFSRVKEDGVFELRGGRFRPVDPDEKPLDVATYDAEIEARVKSLEGEIKRLEAKLSKLAQLGLSPSPRPSSAGAPGDAPAAAKPGPSGAAKTEGSKDADASPSGQENASESAGAASTSAQPGGASHEGASDPGQPEADAEADKGAADAAAQPATDESEEPAAAENASEEEEPAEVHENDAHLGPPIKLPSLEEFSAVFDELVGGEVTLSLADEDDPKGKKGKKRKKPTQQAPDRRKRKSWNSPRRAM